MGKPVLVEIRPRGKNEPIDRMIKRFIKKAKKERIIEECLERRYYEKPSIKRKKERRRRKKTLEKLKKSKPYD